MNIIITGASNGIGFHTALALAENAAAKILAISRNTEKLKELVKKSSEINKGEIIPFAFDLSNLDKFEILTNEIQKHFTSLDILINNAGHLVNKPFSDLTDNDWATTYNINVFAVSKLIKITLPLLQKSDSSHIINISSMGAIPFTSKYSGLSSYSTSKAAIAILTECLAEELKDKNIKINCLALGAVQTEMVGKAFPDYQAPLSPQQIAQFISQFALNSHKYLNGKIIPVSLSNP